MFQIETNIPDFARRLDGFQRQVPFALARALTDAAQLAATVVREELPKHFVIRSNWVQGAVQFRAAQKHNPVAVVGVSEKSAFMVLQEEGGTKTKGARLMAVPAGPEGPSRSLRGADLKGKTLRSRWPSNMPGTFTLRTREGKQLVMQRHGRGKRKTRTLYVLKASVSIKKRWNFTSRVVQVARDVLGVAFANRMNEAVRSAR